MNRRMRVKRNKLFFQENEHVGLCACFASFDFRAEAIFKMWKDSYKFIHRVNENFLFCDLQKLKK